ncbi:cyclic di-GMP receptor LapD [Pseudomonas sp. TUM22785]|uniref:cyclic di-GMP receptor LapD n=1 Tax=Pseudomonas sp. TUM22785 TaxID=3019098 RepID=UPI00230644FF|nr:EAL domain-containing protein [Pseudomonas sp. TUM22785]WCD78135.1 EAL domain-containing protein [Pseudomonas sp. TUM22785]
MSLFKQLLIAICLFLVVAFSGSFMVSLESSREQYVNQLRSHAQDAATALGLSLTPHIDDAAMVELMVSSIFDSGYFERIRVIDMATGKVIVERTGVPDAVAAQVPQWFVSLIGLESAGGDAIVSRGWTQAARVEVQSHPMFAIAKLWQSALGSLGWLALCGLVSAGLGAVLLRRQLRPLDYMVEQSHAIARREFLSLPQLPRTPELRRVVQAMNQMVEKLKALFQEQAERSERLRDEAYQDSLTGLGNRRYFEMQLSARLSAEDQASSGYLLLLRVNDLAGLNQRLGGQRTDQLLKAVAEQLVRNSAGQGAGQLLARSRGGEFILLAPGLVREEAEQLATRLDGALGSLASTGATDTHPVAHIGLVPFAPGESQQDLMMLADEALAQAERQADRAWACIEQTRAGNVGDDRHAWHALLDKALAQGRFQLFFQPVVASREPSRVLHYKVLSRLPDEQGESIPAGRFLPWLERFGWSTRLDLVMLELVLAQMAGHDQPLALNLSGALLRDEKALNRALDLLRQHPQLGPRLTLELEEDQLPEQAVLESLTRRLRELGFALSLQHFGGRFSMIGNLARLGLAYLKVDGSHIRAIDTENDKRLFIEAMQRAAHSIDLPLIAERVETEGELRVLQEMGIQGAQGQLFGAPAPWR